MSTRSVVPLPLLGLLTAWGVKQYLLELLVAQLPLPAAGPGKLPVIVMTVKRAIKAKME